MSDAGRGPRKPRFPLRLDDTTSPPRRLVSPPLTAPGASAAAAARGTAGAAAGAALAGSTQPVALPLVASAVAASPADARTLAVPVTGADDGASARARMVERLRQAGCTDLAVLEAMARVPRQRFVDGALAAQAYEDTALPIGLGQTISKPSVVARMLQLLRERPGGAPLGRVLEIGTGCGYQAAVLAGLARQVYSIERLKALYDKARDNLADLRPAHLRLIYGDGRLGHPPNAPYDGIVAAAGGQDLPAAWLEQLAPMGRLVAPLHDARHGMQALVVVDRLADGRLVQQWHEAVRFVPLESGTSDFGIV